MVFVIAAGVIFITWLLALFFTGRLLRGREQPPRVVFAAVGAFLGLVAGLAVSLALSGKMNAGVVLTSVTVAVFFALGFGNMDVQTRR
ncbi:MAG: hypothetical protein AB7L91_08070 [Dehalococcoidia bacterium]